MQQGWAWGLPVVFKNTLYMWLDSFHSCVKGIAGIGRLQITCHVLGPRRTSYYQQILTNSQYSGLVSLAAVTNFMPIGEMSRAV